MGKKLKQNIIWTLAIILIITGLTGCITPASVISKPVENKVLLIDTIANMPKIINVLGCVFAPASPACQKDIKDKPISALTDAEIED